MSGFNTKKFLKELNSNKFIKACEIPLGYKAGYPVLRNSKENTFILIPYRKYKKTNKKDKSAVMPIEYLVTFELHAPVKIPEKIKKVIDENKLGVTASPTGFEVLRNSDEFKDVDFDKPIGVFPHNELEKIGNSEYKNKVEQMYKAYDEIINGRLGIYEVSDVSKLDFKHLLSELIEPGLKPMYTKIDKDFADKYIV